MLQITKPKSWKQWITSPKETFVERVNNYANNFRLKKLFALMDVNVGAIDAFVSKPWGTNTKREAFEPVVHQIWLGPNEPPCMWIDAWRKDFVEQNERWTHELWNESSLREQLLPCAVNGDLIERELAAAASATKDAPYKNWRVLTTLVSLELLFAYGGVYIDVDSVPACSKVGPRLDRILKEATDKEMVFAKHAHLSTHLAIAKKQSLLAFYLMALARKTYLTSPGTLTDPLFLSRGLTGLERHFVALSIETPVAKGDLFARQQAPAAAAASEGGSAVIFHFGYTRNSMAHIFEHINACASPKTCAYHKRFPKSKLSLKMRSRERLMQMHATANSAGSGGGLSLTSFFDVAVDKVTAVMVVLANRSVHIPKNAMRQHGGGCDVLYKAFDESERIMLCELKMHPEDILFKSCENGTIVHEVRWKKAADGCPYSYELDWANIDNQSVPTDQARKREFALNLLL